MEPASKNLNALLPKTRATLELLSNLEWLKSFTLVGGSGLSLYLSHRLSEDLDFFSWNALLDKETIIQSVDKISDKVSLVTSTETQLDFLINGVKVTFFANNWEHLKFQEPLVNNAYVATLDVIAAMKVHTLFIRAKFRDYYDVYALHQQGKSLNWLFETATEYIPSITKKLFQMALVYTEDIEDDDIKHLKPRYRVSKASIGRYFSSEIEKWNKEQKR